jgi:peptide/nickel transport system substrate-binding protein
MSNERDRYARMIEEVRRAAPTRRQILKGGLAAGALLATSAVPIIGSAQTPKRGGTMRVAFVGTPSKLDIHQMTGVEEVAIGRNVYDSLVHTDHMLVPRPELATSWEATPDAKIWTFQLRKGVKFHHGREMDADDVVWSYKRILDPATASPARSVFSNVQEVVKLDKYVVRFTLTGPFAEFPALVGGSFQARIAPRDIPDLGKTPTGTGPFKLTEYVTGDHATMVRNPDYWRDGQPYLDQLRFLFLPEESSHMAGLMSGNLEMSWSPLPEVLPIYRTNKDIVIQVTQTNGYQPIVMGVDKPPFNDPLVRRAFRLLCDRPAMNKIVLGELNVAPSNDHPIPPGSPMFMDQKVTQQNIDEAKKLLAEAGHKNGLDVELMAWTGRAGLVQEALAFQDMAKKANVRITVNTVPSDVFLSKFWPGKHNFFVTNWSARTSLYELIAIAYASDARWNESHWNSPKLDGLIAQIRSEQDEAKRKQVFAEVQRLFLDDGPVIVSYHRPRVTATRSNVKGFQPHPSAWVDVRTVWLS